MEGLSYPVDSLLVSRYNLPGPRYTSYPTAPQFTDRFGPEEYLEELGRSNVGPIQRALSLYLHLPFCRSLCYYCGCHMMVTHRPEKIEGYLGYLGREMDLAAAAIDTDRPVHQVHWGGGTPTYLSAGQIRRLMEGLGRRFRIVPEAEISIEADPRGLTDDRLVAIREAGFNRISFGIQDFDERVQSAIGRVQPLEVVERVVSESRRLGFEGISFDLIYGLPYQSVASYEKTLELVIRLAPDRISLFSYAHVPWLKKHQEVIPVDALPSPETKMRIFTRAIEVLTGRGGYRHIGMDHFARPEDSLCRAQDEGDLYRNFQGYSTHAGSDMLAFGISGISQLEWSYAQNVKDLPSYTAALDEGTLPIQRGLRLTAEDQLRRYVITRLMCDFGLSKHDVERRFEVGFDEHFAEALKGLESLERDGLVRIDGDRIEATGVGRLLIRNVAMLFDAYLAPAGEKAGPRFSQTV